MKYQHVIDQYRAMLNEALVRMEMNRLGRTAEILAELEDAFLTSQDMEDKFLYHAALVGIATTMQLTIEANEV